MRVWLVGKPSVHNFRRFFHLINPLPKRITTFKIKNLSLALITIQPIFLLSKYFNYPVFPLLLICVAISACSPIEPIKQKPNFIVILADDQCFNTINALGNNEVITPNLDKLVNSGVSFSNSFNMGGWNGAVCIASRTMLFTGKSIWNAYKADSLMKSKKYDTPLWSELMKSEGYDTYMSGKWHIKKEAREAFKYVKHIRPGMPNQTESGYNRPLFKNDTIWKPWDKTKEGFWKGGKHWSEVLKDDALSFFDSISKSNNPFFMYLAFNAPHDPRQSPKKYVDLYNLENIEIPTNFLPEYPYNEEMGSGKSLRDERLAPFPRTEHAIQVNRQEYYASISHMDAQIGEILTALKSTGKIKNTYIIFASDHGLSVGHHGLMGKQNMYEHSIKTPLIIVGPNIKKATTNQTDVYVQDIMPTVLEFAKIKKPYFIDFKSIAPLISKKKNDHYPAIYGCYTMKQRMIRSNGFKLIAYPVAKKLRLFNIVSDPNEINDLADNSKYKSIKENLFKKLIALQKEMKDPLDLNISFE